MKLSEPKRPRLLDIVDVWNIKKKNQSHRNRVEKGLPGRSW